VRDRKADYAAAGARVIGISPDEVKDVDKFAGRHDLDFTLLADADHAIAEKYGTWVEKSMYGNKYMGVQRATFIIDPKGKIARVFPKVQPKKHDELVLKALGELAAA
jgi:peroxiredoxin Q/BCP